MMVTVNVFVNEEYGDLIVERNINYKKIYDNKK